MTTINPTAYTAHILFDVDLRTVTQLDNRKALIPSCCEHCQTTYYIPIRATNEAIAVGGKFGYALIGYPCQCVRFMPYNYPELGHPEFIPAGEGKQWKQTSQGYRQVPKQPLLVNPHMPSSDADCSY